MIKLKNPYLTNLKIKLENFTFQTDLNKNLNSYLIENINRIDQLENLVNLNKILLKKSFSGSWNLLKQYKNIPGVYQFTIGSESYLGST